MGKNKLKSIIFGTVLIIGLIIIMKSINLGKNEVSNIVVLNGGSMDTNTYLIYLEQSIAKYRFVGAILSILGGLGILINTSGRS